MTEHATRSLLHDTAFGVSGEVADAVHGAKGYDDTFSITDSGDVYYQVKRDENPLTPNNYGAILRIMDDYTETLKALGAVDARIELGKTGIRVSILAASEVGEAGWQVFETPYEDESLPQVAS